MQENDLVVTTCDRRSREEFALVKQSYSAKARFLFPPNMGEYSHILLILCREFNFEVRHSPMPPDGTLRI
ncbi:hypothetical protein, partial [Aeromonas media]|uniref:hypothetical protein n=1 Tax=Aeromonas media TaxID=651 RepID=UPI0035E50257